MIPEKPYVVVTVRGRDASANSAELDKLEQLMIEAGYTTFGFSADMAPTASVDALAGECQSETGPAIVLVSGLDVLDQRDHLNALQGAMTRITRVSETSE